MSDVIMVPNESTNGVINRKSSTSKAKLGLLSNMFKPSRNVLTDRSKAVLLLWVLFVICVSGLSVILSCLFLAAL